MHNTLKSIDLFAGVGGMSYGFEMAGFHSVLAVEKDANIAKAYQANFPNSYVLNNDVQHLNIEKIFSDLRDKIDVIFGGPPCQGFSQKGKRLNLDDERNYLVKYFLDVVSYIQPKALVIENVPNLLTTSNGYFFNIIKKYCEQMGYKINAKILDASNFGVPQQRKRAFIIGIKYDVPFDFNQLKNTPPPKLSEIFSDLPEILSGEGEQEYSYTHEARTAYQLYLRTRSSKIYNHQATNHSDIVLQRLKMIPYEGGGKESLPQEHITKSIFSGTWTRLKSTGISKTITTRFDTPSSGQFLLPTQNRCLTVREAARIQSFPDDFIFSGPKSSQMMQVGNAVPPLLAYAVAQNLKKILVGSSD